MSVIKLKFILILSMITLGSDTRGESETVLWDNWYTVTIGKNTAYQYYNERLTLKKDSKGEKLYFQNQVWKNEEGYINEEHLGAFAENNSSLTPIFYNFHSTYRQSETKIDGTVTGGFLNIVSKQGEKSLPVVKRALKKDVIFSIFFPVWIGRKLSAPAGFKLGKPEYFESILEDNIDIGFSPVSGQIKVEKDDLFAVQTKSKKMTVDFRGVRSIWWVDSHGAAVRIDNSTQQAVILRVPRERAQSFFDEPSKVPAKASPKLLKKK